MTRRRQIDVKIVEELKKDKSKEGVFDQIYNFYRDQIFFFAYSYLKNREDAEEVTQETFILLYQKIEELKKIESFDSWLFKICYFRIMTLLRTKQKDYKMVDKDSKNYEALIQQIKDTKEDEEQNYIYEVVSEEVAGLSERLKGVAYLYYFEGFTMKEIGLILEIPEGTVKSRINKLKKVLQEKLVKRGIDETKLWGIGWFPILFKVYNQMIHSYGMTMEQSKNLLSSIKRGAVTIIPFSCSLEKKSFSLKKRLGLSFSGALLVTGIFYLMIGSKAEIGSVFYSDQKTRFDVEVEVKVSGRPTYGDIEVTHNDLDIDYEWNGKKVTFIASENGVYHIKVKKEKREVTINNIDKIAPKVTDIQVDSDGIQVSATDEESGVDFSKSYIESDGNKYQINQLGMIKGDFSGNVEIILYDQVGNSSTYNGTIKIEEG